MPTLTRREPRNNSAKIPRRVEQGEALKVTNHGVPVAVIGPAAAGVGGVVARGEARAARPTPEAWPHLRPRLRVPHPATLFDRREHVGGFPPVGDDDRPMLGLTLGGTDVPIELSHSPSPHWPPPPPKVGAHLPSGAVASRTRGKAQVA